MVEPGRGPHFQIPSLWHQLELPQRLVHCRRQSHYRRIRLSQPTDLHSLLGLPRKPFLVPLSESSSCFSRKPIVPRSIHAKQAIPLESSPHELNINLVG